jgi:hypothetical protein
MKQSQIRNLWESLNGAIIDDAYDGCGVLNRSDEASIVINDKENCDSLVEEHNALVVRAAQHEQVLRLFHEVVAPGVIEIEMEGFVP